MSIILASLNASAVSLRGKVALFSARLATAKAEAVKNEETFIAGTLATDGDEALTAMVAEGYASLSRALKLKTTKLETSIDEASKMLTAVEAEIASKTAT